jgi:hypothetical protein
MELSMTTSPILRVEAADQDRNDCPIRIAAPAGLAATVNWLVDENTSRRTPAQIIEGHLVAVIDGLSRGSSRRYRLESGEASDNGLGLTQSPERFDLAIDGARFTSYWFESGGVRPYFYPLNGPTGVGMTRNYPMREVAGESTDHPHHRSLYVAFGDVNGVDVWAEPPHPNTGRIVHQSWNRVEGGPVVASLRESLRWVDGQGQPLLDEQRQIHAYATRAIRVLDLDLTLTPSSVAVLFGDTKEGGPLAVRVATPLEGARGGTIENANGGRREAETWGKRSPWVDYSGRIGEETVGIALMDHPTGFRHPTWWHVRDYGLFAANPFGLSAFTNDPNQRGDYRLEPGHSIAFHYRVVLHQGNASSGQIDAHYGDYANPPSSSWE